MAVAVTAERLKATQAEIGSGDPPDFTIEHWGVYEAEKLSELSPTDFRSFVLHSFGATKHVDPTGQSGIHGWRNKLPIWVGDPDSAAQVTHEEVTEFANAIRRTVEYRDAGLREGTMLAWNFAASARDNADRLRQQGDLGLAFVQLDQVRIDSLGFRRHIAAQSTEYGDYTNFLTFVLPPVVEVGYRNLGGGRVTLDAGDTAVMNADAGDTAVMNAETDDSAVTSAPAEIVNVQWDFDYDGRLFKAATGFNFNRDRNKKPALQVTHKFGRRGKRRVACKVQDSRGGEGMWVGEIDVE